MELENSAIRIVDVQPGDIRTAFNDAVAHRGAEDFQDSERLARTWQIVDANLRAAPPPELVARHVAALIDDLNPPPQVTLGDMFQSIVAPAIFRFLPQRTRVWGLRKYYKL